jgi:hypothetical protein
LSAAASGFDADVPRQASGEFWVVPIGGDNFVGDFKFAVTEFYRLQMHRNDIAAEHGTKKIDVGMNDGNGTVGIAKERSQLDTALGQRGFVGFVANGKNVGEVNDSSGVGVLEMNGAFVLETSIEIGHFGWFDKAGLRLDYRKRGELWRGAMTEFRAEAIVFDRVVW